ncbi:MAG: hypothetical protein ACLQOO_34775 [Terriglobia bacterium]
MSCYEMWSLIVTVTGVSVGIGVLIVYALQLKAMNASVAASQAAATAAKDSAEAAQKNVDIFINKERAWLTVELDYLKLWQEPGVSGVRIDAPRSRSLEPVSFRVCFDGPTPAFIIASGMRASLQELEPSIDDDSESTMTKEMDLPARIASNTEIKPQRCAVNWKRPHLEQRDVEEIKKGGYIVDFLGFIKYRDAFSPTTVPRETKFLFRWEFSYPPLGQWVKYGGEEENRTT